MDYLRLAASIILLAVVVGMIYSFIGIAIIAGIFAVVGYFIVDAVETLFRKNR